jgi:hypothetical protein
MREFHTCDYKYNNWNDIDDHLKQCIKRNKTIKKIRKDLMDKRLEKHKKKLETRKRN